jgi:hypothetical protein
LINRPNFGDSFNRKCNNSDRNVINLKYNELHGFFDKKLFLKNRILEITRLNESDTNRTIPYNPAITEQSVTQLRPFFPKQNKINAYSLFANNKIARSQEFQKQVVKKSTHIDKLRVKL